MRLLNALGHLLIGALGAALWLLLGLSWARQIGFHYMEDAGGCFQGSTPVAIASMVATVTGAAALVAMAVLRSRRVGLEDRAGTFAWRATAGALVLNIALFGWLMSTVEDASC